MKILNKGLFINESPYNIPEGGYTFAMCSLYSNNEIEEELIDEKGNWNVFDLPSSSRILGHVNLLNDEVLLFSQNNNTFFISLVSKDTITVLVSTDCFLYDFKNPIKGVMKTYNSCERVVYFYDGVSDDRFVNIDNLDYHKDNAGNFICDSFLLKPEFDYPSINPTEILNYGGKLKSGSYEIFVRYIDKMNNTTDWLLPSEDVYIYFDNYQDNYNLIQGSDKETNKAIVYNISNLDTDYDSFEVAVAINKSECYLYNRYKIDDNEKTISVTNFKGKPLVTYLELLTPTAKYKSSKSMITTDDRLIRANVSESKIDWGYLQREYANKVEAYFQTVEDRTSDKTLDYNQTKSLMRDEIYALSLVYVTKDGTLGPALHIPGRPLDKDWAGVDLDLTDVSWHNRPASTTNWDSEVFPANDDSSYISGDFAKWRVYNTAKITDQTDGLRGLCGYFECQNADRESILYPETEDCNGEKIYPTNDDGSMQAIRHHRMPDTTLTPHFNSNGPISLRLDFDNINLPSEYPEIVGYFICHSDRNYGKTVLDKGFINSIIQRQYNDFVLEEDVSATEAKRGYMLHQSLQTSMDNNSPKSYTIQTSDNINFPGFGGDQTFLFVPACSETLQYAKEMSEETQTDNCWTHPYLVGFESPKSKIEGKVDFGTYVKFETEVRTESDGDKKVFRNRRKFKTRSKDRLLETLNFLNFSVTWRPEYTSRKLKRTFFVPADRNYFHVGYDESFLNKTQQEIAILDLDVEYESPTKTKDEDSNFPNTGGGYSNVDKIKWCNPNRYTLANRYWWENSLDHLVDESWKMSWNYVSLKNYVPDLHSNLDQIRYVINSKYNTNTLTGDSWITKFAFRKTFYGFVPHNVNWNSLAAAAIFATNKEDEDTTVIGNYPILLDSRYNSVWEAMLVQGYYETDINASMRNEGDNFIFNERIVDDDDSDNYVSSIPVYYQKFYPYSYSNPIDFLRLELNANTISQLTEEGAWSYFQLFSNYYNVFSHYNNTRDYTVTGLKIQDCIDCEQDYVNRVVWSDKALNNKNKDKIFRVNNSIDILDNSSYITNMFLNKENLYLTTKENLYVLPTTNQTLKLNESTVNVGAGDFLSIPPKKNSYLFHSMFGNQGRFNQIETEFGVVYIDQLQYNVVKFSGELKVISEPIRMFLQENLKSFLNESYYDEFGVNYPYLDNHTYKHGIGLYTAYDYDTKRLIIHKQDFKPLYKLNEYEAEDTDYMAFYNGQWYYFETAEEPVLVDFSDKDYFENKCFTVSYDMKRDRWLSFHPYQPAYMFSDNRTFYSLNYDSNEVYKHNNEITRVYYGRLYPYIIEFINFVDAKTSFSDNIRYVLDLKKYDSGTFLPLRNHSFTKGWTYNDQYSSGYYSIVQRNNLYATHTWNNSQKIVSIQDNYHNITGIKNLLIDETQTMFTKDWSILSPYYSATQGYSDKEANLAVHNYNKNLYQLENIKGQFIKTRLFYTDPISTYSKLRFQLVDTNQTISHR